MAIKAIFVGINKHLDTDAASRQQGGTNDPDAQAFDIGGYSSAMRLGKYVGSYGKVG
ncbi:hypothetical protein [Simplicispira suum]|uniref:hypothetical protein n=1 Tax=Simplicispira suum TaxID=2109915 RepID=UPI0014748774|nr:hypothetical protein [Simplicispira suum]